VGRKLSPYLTGNTLHLHYKFQPVNAVRETVAVYCENDKKHASTVCGQLKRFNIKTGGTYNFCSFEGIE
jgi:hypothetical protein